MLIQGQLCHTRSIKVTKPHTSLSMLLLEIPTQNSFSFSWCITGAKLIGYWSTVLGECTNDVVQIWQWPSYKDREHTMETLSSHKEWNEYTRKVKPMIRNQKYSIVLQFPFWPLHYPETKGMAVLMQTLFKLLLTLTDMFFSLLLLLLLLLALRRHL